MKAIQPNLFIPGAAKSGTTSLHELLDLHPDIAMSLIKEPVYWTSNDYMSKEKINWYNDLFKNSETKITGESTTSYMYYPEFIVRVKEQFTEIPKLVFILRNPIDRCYSHYWYLVGRGQEKRDFKTSFTEDSQRGFSKYEYLPNYYYHFGKYAYWLQNFYNNFEADNIKVITLEQLKSNQLKTINSCFSFLSIPELNIIPEIKSNTSEKIKRPKLYHLVRKILAGKYNITKIVRYILPKKQRKRLKNKLNTNSYINKSESLNYPKLSVDDREWITSFYRDDVKKLRQLTGLPFNEWKDFND